MRLKQMKALPTLAAVLATSGCLGSVTPPTDAVPCIFLNPKLEALRAGILAHPETAEAVATPAADIVLGSEAVCG